MLEFRRRKGVAGATETVQLQTLSASGGFTPALNVYDGSESLECDLWPGDDRSVVGSLPMTWNDAPNALVDIAFPLDVMTALDVTWYSGMGKLADGSADLIEFRLEVTPGPGSASAPAAYHTYKDLTDELPWIGKLADLLQDQSGFAEVAALARKWIDAAILRVVPDQDWSRLACGWGRGYGTWGAGSGYYGYYGSTGQAQDPIIAAALDANQLMLTTATGHRFVEASVYYTLGRILKRAAGMQQTQDLIGMGDDYMKQAEKKLMSCKAEIDTNGDGVAEYVFPLNRTIVRRA
jgi:hypothetical protein